MAEEFCMELTLNYHSDGQVNVTCNGQSSHTFSIIKILPKRSAMKNVPQNPIELGSILFNALFPIKSLAQKALAAHPKRILFITDNDKLDAIPWEYIHGPDGFLVLYIAFVRGLPVKHRKPTPDLAETQLHIVAVPSNPIAREITRLDIDGEWLGLRESLNELGTAIFLERVRPPTLAQTRRLVANEHHRVVHFMGHGSCFDGNSYLLFEDECGAPKAITAKDFICRIEDTTFLATLNACVSAIPGDTKFGNIARALVESGVPYALGMRFSISDDDAKAFSRTFYGELARKTSVENSLRHARNSLAESKNIWSVGVPVLYTSLERPASGFATPTGHPQINEHQPPMEVFALPRAEGAFHGRVDELLALGAALTGEPRAKILTIHGAAGQGKTALAREAAERFAHAWQGGVWAISLETKPTRAAFCLQLAQFLGISTDNLPQQSDLERELLSLLTQRRTLVVLDNAETFIEAVRKKEAETLDLAVFLREGLLGTSASLLVTSHEPLGWPGEQVLPLEGLGKREGAALFVQSAPQRQNEIKMEHAEALSERMEGHPLALLLLGLAFNESAISLEQFIDEHETRLLKAEDRYKAEDHRHRTLYASIETSVRYLEEGQKALLSKLWIFRASFLPEAIASMFISPDLTEDEGKVQQEQVYEQLQTLHRRGLLVREVETLADGNILLYRCLPYVRLFAQHYLEQVLSEEDLRTRFGIVCADLIDNIQDQIDRTAQPSFLAKRCRADLEACYDWVAEVRRGWYANQLGWLLQRIGDRQAGMTWLEQALELAQGKDQNLEFQVLINMAGIYQATGDPTKALELFNLSLTIARSVGDKGKEAIALVNIASVYSSTGNPVKALELFDHALLIIHEVGERGLEAVTLNNMALVYGDTGNQSKALELLKQALPIRREVGDKAGEATTLHNLASIYRATGDPCKALELYEQVLPIRRELGDRAGEAATLNNIANVYHTLNNFGKALEIYNQALSTAQEVGNRAGEATTLNNIANVYKATDNLVMALEIYYKALPIRREVGDRAGEATTLHNMAGVYCDTGDRVKALELFEQALIIKREVGDRVGEAATYNNMAIMYNTMGDSSKALELLGRALPITRAVGDKPGEVTTLCNIASIYNITGDPRKALKLYEQALLITREINDRSREAEITKNMAMIYNVLDNPRKTLELFNQALPILQEVGDRVGEATTINNIASILSATGDNRKALKLYMQALQISRSLGDRNGEAIIMNNIAGVYRDSGDHPKALILFEQALIIMRDMGDRNREAVTCFNLAILARDMKENEKALKYLGSAVQLEKIIKHPDYERDLALLTQWEIAIARGQSLPLTSVIRKIS